MGEMAILGREGDTKLIWSSENADEVEHARKTFEDMTKKGFSAFKVKKMGGQGERITEFDSEAEKMILVPMLRGGI